MNNFINKRDAKEYEDPITEVLIPFIRPQEYIPKNNVNEKYIYNPPSHAYDKYNIDFIDEKKSKIKEIQNQASMKILEKHKFQEQIFQIRAKKKLKEDNKNCFEKILNIDDRKHLSKLMTSNYMMIDKIANQQLKINPQDQRFQYFSTGPELKVNNPQSKQVQAHYIKKLFGTSHLNEQKLHLFLQTKTQGLELRNRSDKLRLIKEQLLNIDKREQINQQNINRKLGQHPPFAQSEGQINIMQMKFTESLIGLYKNDMAKFRSNSQFEQQSLDETTYFPVIRQKEKLDTYHSSMYKDSQNQDQIFLTNISPQPTPKNTKKMSLQNIILRSESIENVKANFPQDSIMFKQKYETGFRKTLRNNILDQYKNQYQQLSQNCLKEKAKNTQIVQNLILNQKLANESFLQLKDGYMGVNEDKIFLN